MVLTAALDISDVYEKILVRYRYATLAQLDPGSLFVCLAKPSSEQAELRLSFPGTALTA